MQENKLTPAEIYLQSLSKPKDLIFDFAADQIRKAFPDKHVLFTEHPISLINDEATWVVSESNLDETFTVKSIYWDPRVEESDFYFQRGWQSVSWKGKDFELCKFTRLGQFCNDDCWFLVADSEEDGVALYEEICLINGKLNDEIYVFDSGYWDKSALLFESIRSARLDDLTLHKGLKETLVEDFTLFLGQEEMYKRYNIPWKRGVILTGPPGNGKTHMIKAIVNHFDLNCLYVKSFDAQMYGPQACVASVFKHARDMSPCFLILEDLDTLLTNEIRSYFLNEMDGFSSNEGIITIATCNYPELLDAAITERPSRFDRKYNFDLPDETDRARYLDNFKQRFESDLHLNDDELSQVAKATDGYSYAYLKELYVSSAVRWLSDSQSKPFAQVMNEQTASLREQMKSEWVKPASSNSTTSSHFYD